MNSNLWQECLESLAKKIQPVVFNQWIKPLDAIVSDNYSIITIYIGNRYKLDFINKEYKYLIEETIKSLSDSIKTIEFKIPKDSKSKVKPEEVSPKKEKKAEEKEPETEDKAPAALLAVCSESERILPNEIVRSALFNARNRSKPREYMNGVDIAVIGGGSLNYQGQELRQDDGTLFMQIVHTAKKLPMGSLVEFTPYSMCKALGWGTSSRDYQRLRDSLKRMQATALEVRSPRINGVWGGESMSMIPYFAWRDSDKKTLAKYQVRLAPQLVELFGSVHYTRTDWEQRLALPDGLATWLHTYFASHRKPHPIAIETIMQGAGMSVIKKEMNRILKKALAQLVDIGFLVSWEIVGGFVHVVRA